MLGVLLGHEIARKLLVVMAVDVCDNGATTIERQNMTTSTFELETAVLSGAARVRSLLDERVDAFYSDSLVEERDRLTDALRAAGAALHAVADRFDNGEI